MVTETQPQTQEDLLSHLKEQLKVYDSVDVEGQEEAVISVTNERLSFVDEASGNRNSGRVTIQYVPNGKYLGKLSVFNFLTEFINMTILDETLIKVLFTCVKDVLQPQNLYIGMDYIDAFGNNVSLTLGDYNQVLTDLETE